MKELSIEEKAKRYDEAINKAKKELDACGSQDCDAARQIFRLFPELIEEYKDEKIRKELIKFVKVNIPNEERYIAWLEKQSNPTDINPSEFDLRLNKLLKQFETLPKEELASSLNFYLNIVQNDGTYREEKQDAQKSIDYNEELKKCRENPLYFFDKYVKVKLKEQNPTWSEEDEYIIERLSYLLDNEQENYPQLSCDFQEIQEFKDWLKSLKQRIKL